MKVFLIILIALVAWYVITFLIALLQGAYMYRCLKRYCRRNEGLLRRKELSDSGRLIENKEVKLTFFPNDNGQRSPAIIICPGGGYKYLCTLDEGYPTAMKLNGYGLSAFLFEYGTDEKCRDMSPMKELAAAIGHIKENADNYNVDINKLILIGYSAGGNLCGIFGTKEHGYLHYGVEKPYALFLGYPWTADPEFSKHHCINPWIWLLNLHLFKRGLRVMFKKSGGFSKEEETALSIHKQIDKDYPKTYMFSGTQDIVVPPALQCDLIERALKENNVEHIYKVFKGIPHAVGIAEGSAADGWLSEALEFAGVPVKK